VQQLVGEGTDAVFAALTRERRAAAAAAAAAEAVVVALVEVLYGVPN
jgi:hypothetical protein